MGQEIPDEAVDAAAQAWAGGIDAAWDSMAPLARATALTRAKRALEAAAPHMLSHEREQTHLAHLDAMVNRETKRAEMADAFAYGWREGKGIPTPVNLDSQEILHNEAHQPNWNPYKEGERDE